MNREQLIADLRAAADYLEANPGVPVDAYPRSVRIYHFPFTAVGGHTPADYRAEIDRIATCLQAHSTLCTDGTYETIREFGDGTVVYQASALSKRLGEPTP